MVHAWHITPLLFATLVLADYYIDNANTSVSYAMAPAAPPAQGWEVLSTSTAQLALSITNSTGNYTITLDASNCYDQNYALGVCGTGGDCFVTVPFTGSGISMYVFNAGASGMEASFSVDGSPGVTNSVDAPPPPTYQVSNVSIYSIQGLPSGNHTMVMTVLNWNGNPTSMKFDYAYVNETLVTLPVTTSSSTSTSPTQTSTTEPSTSNKTDIGIAIGGTLAVVLVLAGLVFGIFYLRKRKARRPKLLESDVQVNPFRSEHLSNVAPLLAPHVSQGPSFSQHTSDAHPSIAPLQRSAMLRDALVGHNDLSEPALQPLRRPASPIVSPDPDSSFSDLQSRQDFTAEQLDVIDRLRAYGASAETLARVIEGFVSSRALVSEVDSSRITRGESILSSLPPPSYQTRAR